MKAGHCNLVLAYPAGFQGSSGCINIIRGSHLYCDTAVDNSRFPDSNAPERGPAGENAVSTP
jgi:hypothetical protein